MKRIKEQRQPRWVHPAVVGVCITVLLIAWLVAVMATDPRNTWL